MELMWMTMEEAKAQQAAGTPVIIPFGTVEQHGPHLPLGCDCGVLFGDRKYSRRLLGI